MTTKENNTVVENEVKTESFSWDEFNKIHEENGSDNDIDPTYDVILKNLCEKLDKVFNKHEANNKIYHQRLTCIFSVLYTFMEKNEDGWEVNIWKCKNFSIEMLYEVSEILAKTLENSVNQEKLMMRDIAIYIEVDNMLDALNGFIARCGSTAALTSEESFKTLHAETIETLIKNLDETYTERFQEEW